MIMITNLFSIFDPCTPSFLSANWSSCLLFLFIAPLTFWVLPTRITYLFRSLIIYIFGEFRPIVKKTKFVLIIPISFFTLVIFNNLIGLLPYIFTATRHLVFTLSLGLTSWLSLIFYGWLNNSSNLLVHLIPQGTPSALIPFIVLIETISNLIRPGTLAVRLTANIIAGHLLIVLLSSATPLTPFFLSPVLFNAQVALSLLETAVAFIQAYVFSVLVTLYIAEFTD